MGTNGLSETPHSLFLTDNVGWNTNQNQIKNMFFLHCISSFEGTNFLYKILRYNHKIFYFLLFYISFCISR